MVQCNPSVELKSLARLAFAHYLRTGQCLPESAFGPARVRREVKFNPFHDPRDGRFTFATGGGLAAGVAARPERRRSRPAAGFPSAEALSVSRRSSG